jgi:hypothetical protein
MNKAILAMIVAVAFFPSLTFAVGDSFAPDPLGGIIYGTVYDNSTGEPLSGADVYIFDDNYQSSKVVNTDENGIYTVNVLKGGNFYLYAEYPFYENSEVEYVSVNINEEVEQDFRLDPINYSSRIYGTVTDSETGDPLYTWIEICEEGSNYSVWLISSPSDGYYSLDVNAGTYTIICSSENYYHFNSDPFVVDEGEEFEFNIEMEKINQGINGKVTDENGDPMVDIYVNLQNDNCWIYGTTDDEGQYEIMAEYPGTYNLTVNADGHRPFLKEVTIEKDQMLEEDIQMEKAYLPDPILRFIYFILDLLGIV